MANVEGYARKLNVILGFLLTLAHIGLAVENSDLQYCSFFNNRAPTAQPNLKNCTWFKESSCCMQQEIKATFDKMKPLQGSSKACQNYVNYLMCYICAPNQNIFYKKERLTVCESFCDELYDACKSAILKGSVIRELYANGKEFCRSRRFEVHTVSCFDFDKTLDVAISGAGGTKQNVFLIVIIALLSTIYNSNHLVSHKPSKLKRSLQLHHPANNPGASKTTSRGGGRSNWIWLVPASLLLLLSTPAIVESKDLTGNDVTNWAEAISNSLHKLAEEGLHYDEIQKKYDEARFKEEFINGSANIQRIRQKLGTSTSATSSAASL